MSIQVLPPDVATRIAAGEIVERPVSVIKELVENALDADATIINIELLDGGKRLIRIGDNGIGIPANEVTLAFQRHATSKLRSVEDLDTINTLGFRGEALAAIAAVSQLTIVTRAKGETSGTEMYLEGGEIKSSRLLGAPQGTQISVENLFFNVPARLKFMKQATTERKRIAAMVSRYAMAYPDVRFSLMHGNKELIRTSGNGSLREALVEIYGAETAVAMMELPQLDDQPLREDLPQVTVSGLVAPPDLNRANRNEITIFVNGRWVQDRNLTYAVIQAYHTMLMVGRYPVAIIIVTLSPDEVDVNIHPTKSEVRFRRADAVFSAVQRSVRRTLVDQSPTPQVRRESLWGGSGQMADRRERLSQVTGDRMRQLGLSMENALPEQSDRGGQDSSSAPRRSIPMMRVIGQVGTTYVVAEGPEGLFLLDQHAAHERVLYEQFMEERKGQQVASQELLEPLVIDLVPEQVALVEENLDDLHAVGFIIEEFGRNAVQMRAVPALVAQSNPIEALMAALGDIECGEMPTESTAEQKLIARVCKQAAVKAGQVLSHTEMDALIRQLEQCKAPQTCPHGRPTMLHLSAEQLAKEFGRLGAR